MSIRVMGQCWELQVSAPQKAVLMSLADQANDHGVCWPSIRCIVIRTCLSRRTVIRAVADLEAQGYLSCRHEQGRVTKYTIHPQPPGHGSELANPCQSDTGARVTRLSQSHRRGARVARERCQSDTQTQKNRHRTTTTTTGEHADEHPRLVFPKGLAEDVVVDIEDHVQGLPAQLAQQVVDELAGAMARPGWIKASPVAFARGLVGKARHGEFHPSLGLQVAKARQQRVEQAKAEARERAERERRRLAAQSESSQRAGKAELVKLRKHLGMELADHSGHKSPSEQASASGRS